METMEKKKDQIYKNVAYLLGGEVDVSTTSGILIDVFSMSLYQM